MVFTEEDTNRFNSAIYAALKDLINEITNDSENVAFELSTAVKTEGGIVILESNSCMCNNDMVNVFLKWAKQKPEIKKLLIDGIQRMLIEEETEKVLQNDVVLDPSFSDVIRTAKF